MFIKEAFAQVGGEGGSFMLSIAPLVLIFAVFYFLLIRPQQKKMKDHKAMVEALTKGDKVVTAGGLIGKISKIESDRIALVEISENTQVQVVRSTITEVIKDNQNKK